MSGFRFMPEGYLFCWRVSSQWRLWPKSPFSCPWCVTSTRCQLLRGRRKSPLTPPGFAVFLHLLPRLFAPDLWRFYPSILPVVRSSWPSLRSSSSTPLSPHLSDLMIILTQGCSRFSTLLLIEAVLVVFSLLTGPKRALSGWIWPLLAQFTTVSSGILWVQALISGWLSSIPTILFSF